MQWSAKKLRPFRRYRYEAMKQYVGNNYSDNSMGHKMPLNMLALAVSVYQRYLAPPSLEVLVTTHVTRLKPRALEFEIGLNHLLREINYVQSHRECVMDALFGMGVMKVGLEVLDTKEDLGYLHDSGQPFADPVSLDNFIQDMSATRHDKVAYIGDKFPVPYDWVMEQDWNKETKSKLKTSQGSGIDTESGDYRAERLSQGSDYMADEYEKMVWLWNIWLPRENLVTILPVEGDLPPQDTKEWTGPEQAMYHKLGFNSVPDSLMPLPPVSQWVDLNDLVNRIWRKLGRQAERQKTNLLVAGPAAKDGNKVINANDGEAIYTQQPDAMNEVRFGGIDNQTLGFALTIKDNLNYLMGNVESLAGFSSQSGTLGQDRMLHQSANKMVDDMQQMVAYFNKRVMSDMAMYMWEDPHINLPLVKRIEGSTIEIPFNWTAESREGDFIDYNIEFEPYAMRSSTPGERLQSLNQIMMNMVLPAMSMFEQQGIQFDMKKYLKTVAKYSNIEELNDIVTPIDPDKLNQGVEPYPGNNMMPKRSPMGPPRQYEHINVAGGPSPEAKNQQLAQAALSGAMSPSPPNAPAAQGGNPRSQ